MHGDSLKDKLKKLATKEREEQFDRIVGGVATGRLQVAKAIIADMDGNPEPLNSLCDSQAKQES